MVIDGVELKYAARQIKPQAMIKSGKVYLQYSKIIELGWDLDDYESYLYEMFLPKDEAEKLFEIGSSLYLVRCKSGYCVCLEFVDHCSLNMPKTIKTKFDPKYKYNCQIIDRTTVERECFQLQCIGIQEVRITKKPRYKKRKKVVQYVDIENYYTEIAGANLV